MTDPLNDVLASLSAPIAKKFELLAQYEEGEADLKRQLGGSVTWTAPKGMFHYLSRLVAERAVLFTRADDLLARTEKAEAAAAGQRAECLKLTDRMRDFEADVCTAVGAIPGSGPAHLLGYVRTAVGNLKSEHQEVLRLNNLIAGIQSENNNLNAERNHISKMFANAHIIGPSNAGNVATVIAAYGKAKDEAEELRCKTAQLKEMNATQVQMIEAFRKEQAETLARHREVAAELGEMNRNQKEQIRDLRAALEREQEMSKKIQANAAYGKFAEGGPKDAPKDPSVEGLLIERAELKKDIATYERDLARFDLLMARITTASGISRGYEDSVKVVEDYCSTLKNVAKTLGVTCESGPLGKVTLKALEADIERSDKLRGVLSKQLGLLGQEPILNEVKALMGYKAKVLEALEGNIGLTGIEDEIACIKDLAALSDEIEDLMIAAKVPGKRLVEQVKNLIARRGQSELKAAEELGDRFQALLGTLRRIAESVGLPGIHGFEDSLAVEESVKRVALDARTRAEQERTWDESFRKCHQLLNDARVMDGNLINRVGYLIAREEARAKEAKETGVMGVVAACHAALDPCGIPKDQDLVHRVQTLARFKQAVSNVVGGIGSADCDGVLHNVHYFVDEKRRLDDAVSKLREENETLGCDTGASVRKKIDGIVGVCGKEDCFEIVRRHKGVLDKCAKILRDEKMVFGNGLVDQVKTLVIIAKAARAAFPSVG